MGSLISLAMLLLGGGGGWVRGGGWGVGVVGGGEKPNTPWILLDSGFCDLSGWEGEYCEVT